LSDLFKCTRQTICHIICKSHIVVAYSAHYMHRVHIAFPYSAHESLYAAHIVAICPTIWHYMTHYMALYDPLYARARVSIVCREARLRARGGASAGVHERGARERGASWDVGRASMMRGSPRSQVRGLKEEATRSKVKCSVDILPSASLNWTEVVACLSRPTLWIRAT
jgi:hypothetical protein